MYIYYKSIIYDKGSVYTQMNNIIYIKLEDSLNNSECIIDQNDRKVTKKLITQTKSNIIS